MKYNFSTFDVAEILNIKRPCLQEWIRIKCVKAARPSTGVGKRAVWTKRDLYKVELFRRLLTICDRDRSALIANQMDGRVKTIWLSKIPISVSLEYFRIAFVPGDISNYVDERINGWRNKG